MGGKRWRGVRRRDGTLNWEKPIIEERYGRKLGVRKGKSTKS